MASSRMYNYFFEGIEQPVQIYAQSKEESKIFLHQQVLPSTPGLANRQLIHESTTSLVTDVSKIQYNGKTYIWNGQQWQPCDEDNDE